MIATLKLQCNLDTFVEWNRAYAILLINISKLSAITFLPLYIDNAIIYKYKMNNKW